ncbi:MULTISPECIES: hypothetical protein [Streptomyces]|uniref:Uncharacterized protein n=1 Tax=Streptomyces fradiae ATCC 10745 = DSM 40063 TaxID=1319510 RepID=A0ABQ6XKK8_STRFR|nr:MULTISPECIES: hypothetical protein [Streptomyces]KAF0646311.1 hypothetical protein K701_29545 [Streptomyces fradiae ATCC 10745 = DSM 40063]
MNTTPTPPAPIWTDALTLAAAELHHQTWTGHSGEQVTGEQTASHLDTVAALLTQHGWAAPHTTPSASSSIDIPDDESMTVKDMLRTLLRFARHLTEPGDPRLTFTDAMCKATATSDCDTRDVAGRVLNAILRARTGARFPHCHAWASRADRTWDDITGLLATGAHLARQHGPTTTDAPAPHLAA